MREIPLNICPDCGGDWFREADYYKVLREESVPSSWPLQDLVGQISWGSMPLLVCLCGTPRKPSIGGLKGGRTPNVELAQLLDSLENSYRRLRADYVLAAAEAYLAKLEAFPVLAGRLKALERLAGLRIAQQTPSRESPRGRHWGPPQRQPASGDVLTLDTLVLALQKTGLRARDAKQVVKAIFAAIIDWLRDGGMAETPLGVFEVVRRPAVFGERHRLAHHYMAGEPTGHTLHGAMGETAMSRRSFRFPRINNMNEWSPSRTLVPAGGPEPGLLSHPVVAMCLPISYSWRMTRDS